MARAIVLLSGGLDSSTVLAMAKEREFEITALTFSYGQRHSKELECARKVCERMDVSEHIVLEIPIGPLLDSALTDESASLPENRSLSDMSSEVPSTYVPGRNIIFLSIATSLAESVGASAVFIAANAVDYSGYPDCTPVFIEAFQRVVDLGTVAGRKDGLIKIEAPLVNMTKGQIVQEAVRLGVPLELTWSCYRGGEKACGKCDSCRLRLQGFKDAGADDPLEYEVES